MKEPRDVSKRQCWKLRLKQTQSSQSADEQLFTLSPHESYVTVVLQLRCQHPTPRMKLTEAFDWLTSSFPSLPPIIRLLSPIVDLLFF